MGFAEGRKSGEEPADRKHPTEKTVRKLLDEGVKLRRKFEEQYASPAPIGEEELRFVVR